MNDNTTPDIIGAQPTEADLFYLKLALKEPAERLTRLEETAKFLIGAASGTSGLFLAALRLSIGTKATVSSALYFLPSIFWSLSIAALILVLIPKTYHSGKNEPDAWKEALKNAGKYKYKRLTIGAALFVCDILSGGLLLI